MSTTQVMGCAALMALAVGASGCGSSDDGGASKGGGSGSGGLAGAAGGGAGGTGGAAGAGGAAGSGGSGGSIECTAPPRSLWTWDLGVMPPKDVQVPSTCRAETAHLRVYVADSAWGTDVTDAQVATVVKAFEDATPADKTQGIYALDTGTFGDPPDVDSDPHVILFYVPMKPFQGYTFDGFFREDDEKPGSVSNQAEMLHVSSSGKAIDSDYMLGVVAHEFVHLINYGYDKSDEGWHDESLAEIGMVQAGYLTDLPSAKGYVTTTWKTPLCVASYSDYGATFSWGTYIYDRFGKDFVRSVAQDPADGRASIEAHLPNGTTFRDVLGDFFVATLLDQPGIGDGRYGFESMDAAGLGSETSGSLDGTAHAQSAVAFGSRNLRFLPSGAGTVSITLTSTDLSKLVVNTVVFDPAQPGAAKVAAQDPANPISVSVAAGEVVDLVVAVDAGAALASSQGAPNTQFSYTATYAP